MQLIIDKKIIGLRLIKIFLVICFFSGILSYLSYLFNNEYIKIWKEIYIIILCLYIFNYSLKVINNNMFFFIVILSFFFFLEFIYSLLLNIPINIIIYQLKNDLLLYLFTSCLYVFFIEITHDEIKSFSEKIIKIMIYLGAVNAIAMILEFVFFEQFLNLIGLDMGNWGTSMGVKIITAGEALRPIGLQGGFVQAATLVLMTFIILNENKIYNIKNKIIKYSLEIIFLVAILLSTYATVIIGLIVYLAIKFINKILKINTFMFFSIIIFVFFLYTTHGLGIYEFVNTIYPDKAYSSILIRVLQHWQILDEVNQDGISFLLGVGLGTNGMFGLDKELYGITPIATDSTYIYLFSNYGIIGVLFFIFILIYFIINFYKSDILGMKYCLFYVLIIDFFFNNTLTNFPINFILLLLINLDLKMKRIT
ncbi:hypothetical protein [Megamonas funiformis]|uniref:hypothetical protein n=1 Tax=Megamonas funiformis TaxID=437897 RepID=UPI003521CF44